MVKNAQPPSFPYGGLEVRLYLSSFIIKLSSTMHDVRRIFQTLYYILRGHIAISRG